MTVATSHLDSVNNDSNQEILRFFKDRFRLLLIIYFFSEETGDADFPRLMLGEIKIQAIDFFIRNPDYLAFELLSIATAEQNKRKPIKKIVKAIYASAEPEIRRVEMEKFFYGAYEDIDDIVAFLSARGLLRFESKLRTNMLVADKHYYITSKSLTLLDKAKSTIEVAKWYFERCQIIKDYLGGSTGSELKAKQYQVEEYSSTTYRDKIQQIDELVYEKFEQLYNENL